MIWIVVPKGWRSLRPEDIKVGLTCISCLQSDVFGGCLSPEQAGQELEIVAIRGDTVIFNKRPIKGMTNHLWKERLLDCPASTMGRIFILPDKRGLDRRSTQERTAGLLLTKHLNHYKLY